MRTATISPPKPTAMAAMPAPPNPAVGVEPPPHSPDLGRVGVAAVSVGVSNDTTRVDVAVGATVYVGRSVGVVVGG